MSNPILDRRSFLKITSLAGGGLMIGFPFFDKDNTISGSNSIPINAFIKITSDNVITILSPNPEGGQGVKTSMPMMVAEDLDVDFNKIMVQQADLDTAHFTRQFIGGSQAIHLGWKTLRIAGATARKMLMTAAAKTWNVPVEEITTHLGRLLHQKSNKVATYGEMASIAVTIPIPTNIDLKSSKEFRIIGKTKRQVDLHKIITGKPLFGIDTRTQGMMTAMIVHPPAFGLKLKSFDAGEALKMDGIKDVFSIKIFNDDYERQFFDTTTFNEVIAIVGQDTWKVMQAKKSVKADWIPIESYSQKRNMLGRKSVEHIPAGLENSDDHTRIWKDALNQPATVRRKDGDVEIAFGKQGIKILERIYTAPFLAHNCMEPMNFFAHVTDDRAELTGPLQKPEFTEQALAARLGMPLEKIDVKMTRLGGGFGRRSYAHWMIEAALISKKVKAPVKLIYTREDDMTSGIYRPAYAAKFRAAINENNNLVGFHVKAGGIPESPLFPNRFPAGAVENYLAEDFTIDSNITVGSFRAPRSNFMAAAEQSFMDELAEFAGKDPIEFRLELLKSAKEKPVGQNNEYDADRYSGVLQLIKEKSGWGNPGNKNIKRGVAAYFSHDSYAAHVMDISMRNAVPVVDMVTSVIDCGIVVNPDSAINMVEGCIVDGIGNALYGQLKIKNGNTEQKNFDTYRMIRMHEIPKKIEVHFVKNDLDPSGLGEPPYPPVFGALANALYQATGKRYYRQPFSEEQPNGQGS